MLRPCTCAHCRACDGLTGKRNGVQILSVFVLTPACIDTVLERCAPHQTLSARLAITLLLRTVLQLLVFAAAATPRSAQQTCAGPSRAGLVICYSLFDVCWQMARDRLMQRRRVPFSRLTASPAARPQKLSVPPPISCPRSTQIALEN